MKSNIQGDGMRQQISFELSHSAMAAIKEKVRYVSLAKIARAAFFKMLSLESIDEINGFIQEGLELETKWKATHAND